MRRVKVILMVFAVLMIVATPVFAQGTTAGGDSTGYKTLGLALGMGIAAGLCGVGQGKATSGATEAMARNPGNTAAIRTALIIGLALIESLALYMFVLCIQKL